MGGGGPKVPTPQPRYLPPGQVRMGEGYPKVPTPTAKVPTPWPGQDRGEGVPQGTYLPTPSQGLATRRAVCLLRSRRRTFLFTKNFLLLCKRRWQRKYSVVKVSPNAYDESQDWKPFALKVNTIPSSCGKPQDIMCYSITCLGAGGGGYPIPGLGVGGTPSWPGQGYPVMGYPRVWDWGIPLSGTGVPPIWDWGTPQKGRGTNGSIMGWRYYGMEMGYPSALEQTHACENITSRRTTYAAVIIKMAS